MFFLDKFGDVCKGEMFFTPMIIEGCQQIV